MTMDREPTVSKASAKEKFDTLFGLLKEHYAGLFDFEFKNMTVLTLLLGWALASHEARAFLHSRRSVGYFFCVGLLVYATLLSMAVWRFYRRSLVAYRQLSELRYMPPEYFRPRLIARFTVISFTVLDWIVALLIYTVILAS